MHKMILSFIACLWWKTFSSRQVYNVKIYREVFLELAAVEREPILYMFAVSTKTKLSAHEILVFWLDSSENIKDGKFSIHAQTPSILKIFTQKRIFFFPKEKLLNTVVKLSLRSLSIPNNFTCLIYPIFLLKTD